MRVHATLAALVAASALGAALLAGTSRRAALLGAAASASTAVASLVAMSQLARRRAKPVQSALIVMVAAFLVRLVLVGAGTALVARAGESIFAFAAAFFIPYFAFAAIETAFVHSLRRAEEPIP